MLDNKPPFLSYFQQYIVVMVIVTSLVIYVIKGFLAVISAFLINFSDLVGTVADMIVFFVVTVVALDMIDDLML